MELTSEQREQLDRLAALIADSPHNLVSRGERDRVRMAHVEEGEVLALHLGLVPGHRWIDVGTGGGLPGLVLAIVAPQTSFTLLDSRQKKVEAVDSFARELDLRNVSTVSGRAEDAAHDPAHRHAYDGAIARALARLDVVAELCAGFVRRGGAVVAVKGPAYRAELPYMEHAREPLGLGPFHTTAVPTAVRTSWLVRMPVIHPTPSAFPRRVGVPQAQPLGDSR
jgi:16S rRNA (guanine527-N7)-methyltransferase